MPLRWGLGRFLVNIKSEVNSNFTVTHNDDHANITAQEIKVPVSTPSKSFECVICTTVTFDTICSTRAIGSLS
jgi:hypothetical protein